GMAGFQVTFPDDITSWNTFVLGQDEKMRGGVGKAHTRAFKKLMAQLTVPRFLVEGDQVDVVGKAVNFTKDTLQIQARFLSGDTVLKTRAGEISSAWVEKLNIVAPPAGDSLELSYRLNLGEYEDGEIRKIPIYRKGIEETTGVFLVAEKDTTLQLSFDPDLGPVTVFAQQNALEVLKKDLRFLRRYPYGCNEQTASRLTGLLLEKQAAKWTGEPFDGEPEIIRAIVRLKKSQNPDGSWGWWSGGRANVWMTTYVLRALYEARLEGYKTSAFNKGVIFLTNQVHLYKKTDLLNVLRLFSDIGQNFDYQPFIAQLDTTVTGLYERFALLDIRQARGLPMTLDSLGKYQKRTLLGGVYWNEESYDWYENSIQTTLLAYKIYKRAGREDMTRKIRQYFLEKRNLGWRNTFETARILAAILPDLDFSEKPTELHINGTRVTRFPHQARIFSESVELEKSGGGPLFLTAYQQFHNPDPMPDSSYFKIESHWEQRGRKTDVLEKSDLATLVVRVEVKQTAEYAMIEVPVPAGCSYASKPNFRRFPEVYREYFRDRTAVFCERLPVGTHEFRIELEPRFSGQFTLNPAKVEQMYFPVFFGRNALRRVNINE
ncbi:MAG: hypothetical protein D6714_07990, partial [Bacteroidetes bacterium]